MLYQGSKAATATGITPFSRTLPVGVNLADHYAAFNSKLEQYKMALYDRTKKFQPNYMVISSSIMPLIKFVPGWTSANMTDVNGPFFAGTLDNLKVYVSPSMPKDEFFLGVNMGAMQASAGIYAPYMPVVPTQLLEFADGGNSQGWSTLYDAKILNKELLVHGNVVD